VRVVSLACIVAALVLAVACRREDDPVARLPELPPDLRATLVRSSLAPVLETKSATIQPAAPASPTPPPPSPGTVCLKQYQGYVTYPITVCYPASILVDELNWSAIQSVNTPTTTPQPRYFKLTSFPNISAVRPLFCTARSGPWYAEMTSIAHCDNIQVSDFELQILGAPQPLVFRWSGTLSDIPPPINPNTLTPTGEGDCVCCDGLIWCRATRKCLLPGQPCGTEPPPPAKPPL
jgi:hypothetical protein